VAEDVNVLSMTYFHPVESLTYLLGHVAALFIIPMHPLAISIGILLSVACNWVLHLGHELYPGFIKKYFRLMVSSTYHYDHHQKNKINFGYFSILWDVLFGTHNLKESDV
jgi:sterol desaturase/sphingolipid hydroxylase (fatty acid hydroxylase superfamily)